MMTKMNLETEQDGKGGDDRQADNANDWQSFGGGGLGGLVVVIGQQRLAKMRSVGVVDWLGGTRWVDESPVHKGSQRDSD
jgi:hypothetical protein